MPTGDRYDQACEEAAENPMQHVDLQFIEALVIRSKPTVGQCLEVLDHVCKVPRKRKWSFNVVPQDRIAHKVEAITMSKDALSSAIAKAAAELKVDGTAVTTILLAERYSKLLSKGAGDDAEDNANFRVALQAKVDNLEQKLDQLLARK